MFKTGNKFISFVAFIILLTILTPFTVSATNVSDLQKQMQERSKEIKQKEDEINSKKTEKNAELEKRNKIDLQITAMLDDISDVQAVIDEKEREIQEKNSQIESLTNQINENNEVLKNRLKIMYEYGATSYLQLLLEADGLADLITRISIVKSVYAYDKNIINEYIKSKEQVEQAKQVIVDEQKEQLAAKAILDDKMNNLETLKNEKQQIIDSINSDIKALEREQQQIESDYNAIKNELNSALAAQNKSGSGASVSYNGNGTFLWPSAASTRITSSFGYRTHPISGKQLLHRGIDIGAPLGSDVLAAEAGRVVTSGWNNSYGYYITITHGGGYVTLYAHNSKLLVSAGDNVTRGQVIAKCGSTGNSTGPHIHFEVMINGELKNPLNYL